MADVPHRPQEATMTIHRPGPGGPPPDDPGDTPTVPARRWPASGEHRDPETFTAPDWVATAIALIATVTLVVIAVRAVVTGE